MPIVPALPQHIVRFSYSTPSHLGPFRARAAFPFCPMPFAGAAGGTNESYRYHTHGHLDRSDLARSGTARALTMDMRALEYIVIATVVVAACLHILYMAL